MDSPEIMIREATVQDLQQILEIYNDAIIHTTAVYSEIPHTLAMRLDWYKERKEADFPIIVAASNGAIAGFGSYGNFRAWPCYRFTAEHSVYVHQDYRRLGISKLLVKELLLHAKNAGLHALIAGIDSENTVSLNLHAAFGFVKVAHFKEVGFKFNRWLDLVFLELLL